MNYIIEGPIMTNRLCFTDGRVIEGVMGGTGFYALSGAMLCSSSCLIVAGIGKDFREYYGKWFSDNGALYDGLKLTVPKTTYNELSYKDDGTYEEESIYGPEYNRTYFKQTMLSLSEYCHLINETTKGLYTCAVPSHELKEGLKELRKHSHFRVMWEIPANMIAAFGEIYRDYGLDGIIDEIKYFDMVSLNKPESFRIFGTNDINKVIDILKGLKRFVYFRDGKNGAYAINGNEVVHVPLISTVSIDKEIDPTGCGNSSTAAAMWAYCEGYDLLMTAIIAGTVASYTVRQYGPYPLITEATRIGILHQSERIYKTMRRSE